MISFVGKLNRCCTGATNLRIPQLWRGLAFSLVLGFAPLSLQAESLFSWTITQVEPSTEQGMVLFQHEFPAKSTQTRFALELPLKTMKAWTCKLHWKQEISSKQVQEKLFVRCTTASREFRVTGRVACVYRFSDRRWIFGETTFDLEAWKGRKVIGMATFQLRCDREEHTSSGS